MRVYELVVVLKSSLSETERKKQLASIKDWLKGVTISKENAWGQKPLAYKIKKELAGVYHQFIMETENVIPSDLEKRLLTNENIIRHLLLRTK